MNIKHDAVLFNVNHPNLQYNVYVDKYEVFIMDEGEFLIEDRIGLTYIARFTGRLRKMWGRYFHTIERFDVETVADEQGVLRGVKGKKINGTLACPMYFTY